jgi:hypothetical protein
MYWFELLVFVLLFYLIWKNYWKIQCIFAPEKFCDIETPESFPLKHKKKYNARVKDGFNKMKNLDVTICGMVRDVGDRVEDIKERVESMGRLVRDYRVLIVENDSTDDTRKNLLDWVSSNPRVYILGCGVNESSCHLNLPKTSGHSVYRERIEKMCKLRNIYL